jgi:hypothetical protein
LAEDITMFRDISSKGGINVRLNQTLRDIINRLGNLKTTRPVPTSIQNIRSIYSDFMLFSEWSEFLATDPGHYKKKYWVWNGVHSAS